VISSLLGLLFWWVVWFHRAASYLIEHASDCDIVHMPDHSALAYVCTRTRTHFACLPSWVQALTRVEVVGRYETLVARAEGNAALQRMRVVVQGHGDSRLMAPNSGVSTWSPAAVLLEAKEVACMELADAFVTPSKWYMYHVVAQRGARLNHAASFVVPNIVPPSKALQDLTNAQDAGCTRRQSLAFYGRHTAVKGLTVFLDAALALCGSNTATTPCPVRRVMFLGSHGLVNGESATALIRQTCDQLTVPCVIDAHIARARALQLLAANDAIAVVPSISDIAPLVVSELADAGIPFVASNAGGIPELLSVASAPRLFQADNTLDLVRVLTTAVQQPCWVPQVVATDHSYQHALEQWRLVTDKIAALPLRTTVLPPSPAQKACAAMFAPSALSATEEAAHALSNVHGLSRRLRAAATGLLAQELRAVTPAPPRFRFAAAFRRRLAGCDGYGYDADGYSVWAGMYGYDSAYGFGYGYGGCEDTAPVPTLSHLASSSTDTSLVVRAGVGRQRVVLCH